MNLCSLFPIQARQRPTQAAIIETIAGVDRSMSFAELDDASARAAALLRASGVSHGGRVLVLVPMSIELYVIILGVMRLGAVVTLLDPSAGVGHINRCCRMAQPAALVGVAKSQLLRMICSGLRSVPIKFTLGTRWLPGKSWRHVNRTAPLREIADASEDDAALLTFTSGSTGGPKAAVRSHGLLLAQQEALGAALRLDAGTADLTTLPVFVLSNLALGVTSVIPGVSLKNPGAIESEQVMAQIDRHAPSSVVASPALLARLTQHCERHGRTMPSFRRVFTGGAPVFWHSLDTLAAAAPNARVFAVYGSTEAEPIADIALDELTTEDRSITASGLGLPAGAPVPHVQLRILPDRWGVPIQPLTASELDALALPPGEMGEIAVTGRHVLKGYLNGTGDTETKFRVGDTAWHRTGDAGYLDHDGRLWLVGRCQGKVSDERGVVYPLQVEGAAHALEPLRRCALVQHNGLRVLIIEPTSGDGLTEQRRLSAALAWAHVAQVVPVERIPVDRRHNAKIDYPALRRLIDRW